MQAQGTETSAGLDSGTVEPESSPEDARSKDVKVVAASTEPPKVKESDDEPEGSVGARPFDESTIKAEGTKPEWVDTSNKIGVVGRA